MKVLIVTIEGGGNVPPVLNLTQQLIRSGHAVTILSEPWFKELAEGIGAHFTPFTEYFTKTDRTHDMFQDCNRICRVSQRFLARIQGSGSNSLAQ